MIKKEFLIACENNDIYTLNKLISEVDIGALINTKNIFGSTGLMSAVINGHFNIVETLIKKGAGINIKNDAGMTALMFAVGRDNINIFNNLIENGADIEIKNNKGKSAYDIAIFYGDVQILCFLKDDAIRQKDKYGNTLLMRACINKKEDDVLFLYSRPGGDDFFIKNNKGLTPYDVLMNHDRLPAKLQALKEKLILDKMACEEDELDLKLF